MGIGNPLLGAPPGAKLHEIAQRLIAGEMSGVAFGADAANAQVVRKTPGRRERGLPVSQPARASRGAARVATPDDHGPCQMKGPLAASLPEARAVFEAQYISEVLHRHDGNVSRAAAALGVSRVALQKKMKRYGLR
jgi:DNA-binding NtrC family response regulator